MSDAQKRIFNLDDFNPADRKSMFIEASAGTGKTFTITGIVKKLVADAKIPLEKILIVTYTEKAVGELKDRIRASLSALSDCNADVDNAPIHTIHSFCQKTLDEFAFSAGQPFSLTLASDSDLDDFIDRWIRDSLRHNPDFERLYRGAEKPSSFINILKRDFKAAIENYYLNQDFKEDADVISLDGKTKDDNSAESFFARNLAALYAAWQEEKSRTKTQTYNDMIRSVREAVCNPQSDLKIKLQEKYSYAIIDEFQDTNKRQWDIFRSVFLQDDAHTVIVVGDPKQSIYSFQGADVNVYQTAVDEIAGISGGAYSLATNWRSTDIFVNACNSLFCDKTGTKPGKKIQFFSDEAGQSVFSPSKPCGKISDATFGRAEEPVKPFWMIGSPQTCAVSADDFARVAVRTIVECCAIIKSADGGERTNLRIFDKAVQSRRNVTFRDFAVLARTKSEMEAIEKQMRRCGVPYSRYKDKGLFSGAECSQWISLLAAISADDFTGRKRAILSEALFTKFFGIPISELQSQRFDEPTCDERQKILGWQLLARKKQWAKLLETIFKDTALEENLSSLESLSSLAKFRQIGNYIIEYLYKNECSLEEAAKHLARLADSAAENDEQNIIAKSTDFDCVQVMTIHASKGLDFPVVVAAAGFKRDSSSKPKVYQYHEGGKSKLGFSDYGKKLAAEEEAREKQRLFYVAYTRAQFLMILPYYDEWQKLRPQKHFVHLRDNLTAFLTDPANEQFWREIPAEITADEKNAIKKQVQAILRHADGKNPDGKKGDGTENQGDKEAQILENAALAKKVPALALKKHSYSSISHSAAKSDEVTTDSAGRLDKEGATSAVQEQISLAQFDGSENPVSCIYNPLEIPRTTANSYPKGAKLGIALHEIFEKADFQAFGGFKNPDEAQKDAKIISLIDECFERQTLRIDQNDSLAWRAQTADFLWHTLNARLPQIQGGKSGEKTFCLKDIADCDRISEAEFNMSLAEKTLRNYCNGFIDLMFRRGDVYSILDWKSDALDPSDFSDADALGNHTDSRYSVQRVLYSYSLVRWLSQFFAGKSDAEIFESHFGGIYYVYVRGCHAGTSNGIYARTWKNWAELEAAFNKIYGTLINSKAD